MLLAAIPLRAMTLPANVKRTAADQKPGASAAAVRTRPNEIADPRTSSGCGTLPPAAAMNKAATAAPIPTDETIAP